jgi:Uma2 family endonuclease
MTAVTRLMTAEELWVLPSGNHRHELVRGELLTTAPSGFNHGVVINRLAFLLTQHVYAHRLGLITGAETGFVLARNPDTVRAPDIGFVAMERVNVAGRPENFWEGAPDLAVEILSPSDTVDTFEGKVDDYLAAGTPLIWVVSPRRKTVTNYRANRKPQVLADGDILSGEDVVAGFEISVAEIFE